MARSYYNYSAYSPFGGTIFEDKNTGIALHICAVLFLALTLCMGLF